MEEQDAAFERLAKRPPVVSWLQGTAVNASALFSMHGATWALPAPATADAPEPSLVRPCLADMASIHRRSTAQGASSAFAAHGVQ